MPLLLILMKVSSAALLQGTSFAANAKHLLALLMLNTIVVALSYILFPYLWRD
jgi:heme exporter protein B